MRLRIKRTFVLLLTVAAATAAQAVAQTPVAKPANASVSQYRAELALGYSYLHSNAPPGGCGCFNMNGGSATFAWPLKSGMFALAGDVTIAQAGAVSTSGDNLTLSTFTAGGRYLPRLSHSSLQPFGQVLAGMAHSSGTLVQGSNPGAANAGAAFAADFGGGLDLHTTPRFSLRLFEADYLLTTFDNGTNNHQNNLRVSAGVVMHFGEK
jgi:peptidoglycan-associated lipoprotein